MKHIKRRTRQSVYALSGTAFRVFWLVLAMMLVFALPTSATFMNLVEVHKGGVDDSDSQGKAWSVSFHPDRALASVIGGVDDTLALFSSPIMPGPDTVPSVQQAKLIAPDGGRLDYLGQSVAISGNTAVVGSASHGGMGAAYVYVRDGTTWTLQAKLTAPDGSHGDDFGWSAAISGNTILVGARLTDDQGFASGAAYLFVRDGTTWTLQQKVLADDGGVDHNFGAAVALEGDTALIGASGDDEFWGAAYIYVRSGTTWTQQAKLLPRGGNRWMGFGSAVALSGNTALVGAPGHHTKARSTGSATVFIRKGTIWIRQMQIAPRDGEAWDFFGTSVGLSGDTAMIGCPGDDGKAADSGSVYVYTRSGAIWTQRDRLFPADGESPDGYGRSVALLGDVALVGAYRDNNEKGQYAGSAYVYSRDGTAWEPETRLTALDGRADQHFGSTVALTNNAALIGAVKDNDLAEDSGAAYVFVPAPGPSLPINVPCNVPKLIAALNAANATSEPDTINLAEGCTYTLTTVDHDFDGPTGLPAVTSEITIEGNNATIERSSSAPNFRILHLADEGNLTVNRLTIRGGLLGRWSGSGIYAFGTLRLNKCTIRDNRTEEGYGGGIHSPYGQVTLTQTTVRDNEAYGGGGIGADGGTLDLIRSTIRDNTAQHAGGINNRDGIATLTDSTVDHNRGWPGGGGGIISWREMTLIGTTVSRNLGQDAGGIMNFGIFNLIKSTISDNDGGAGSGGAIANGGTLSIDSSTISGNRSGGSGSTIDSMNTVTLVNSIIVGENAGNECHGSGFTSQGYNLGSDDTCGLDQPTDQPSATALLGPLQDNGGPTETHALLSGSPAIDQGSCPGCTTDQRGKPRPVDLPGIPDADDGCDIGAFEFQYQPLPSSGYVVAINVLHKNQQVLPNWRVTVYAGPDGTGGVRAEQLTDANGRVVLRLPNGSHSYNVAHGCYESGFTNFTVNSARLSISHQAVVPLEIRVVNSAGQAQPGIVVRLYDADMHLIWWRTTPDSGWVKFNLDADEGHYYVVERNGVAGDANWHLACEPSQVEHVIE